MKKRFLLPIAALAALTALTVFLFSPYAPVIGPYREIEAQWAIEDERQESETPLVTRLEMDGMPLAYSEEENAFYCPLMPGDGWPDLHITAPDARGVTLFYADDYGFDDRAGAVADGARYLVMAYTQEAFAYFELVFTGMPALSLTVGQEIGVEDAPARLAVSAWDGSGGYANCRVHRRGASTLAQEKGSYRIEFTRGAGHKKVYGNLPGLGAVQNAILLACGYDATLMRDRLCWEMYARLAPRGTAFGARGAAYVELFIDGRYEGVYLMLEPFDVGEELAREDASLTDSVYRTAVASLAGDRPILTDPAWDNTGYELFYAAEPARPFDALEEYVSLCEEENDARFAQRAQKLLDLDSLLRYEALLQGCGMTDNTYNNLYVRAHPTAGGMRYSFAPWDMDLTWGLKPEDIGEEYENWLTFALADRVLRLDVDGARGKLAALWARFRETALHVDAVRALTDAWTRELGESGAYARNATRWGLESYSPDAYEIDVFAQMRFALLDGAMQRLASAAEGERIPFLESDDIKGVPIEQ